MRSNCTSQAAMAWFLPSQGFFRVVQMVFVFLYRPDYSQTRADMFVLF